MGNVFTNSSLVVSRFKTSYSVISLLTLFMKYLSFLDFFVILITFLIYSFSVTLSEAQKLPLPRGPQLLRLEIKKIILLFEFVLSQK